MFAVFFIAVAVFFIWAYPDEASDKEKQYYHNQGYVFGTYYNICYEHNRDLHEQIKKRLQEFDNSMSAFNENSTLSKLNSNQSDKTDRYFEQMYSTAYEVWQLSNGAFDITVAPLVNSWGFGFRNKESVSPEMIDSLRRYVGFEKIHLNRHHLQKDFPQTMIDCGAIAKGQGCDVIAELLQDKGCQNYLVDIGGEAVCHGYNEQSQLWRVGIVKPQDDPEGKNRDLQTIVQLDNKAMATSGNYRRFYYEGDMRRSHTIDPRTGYPVQHSLLSATVVAPTCMQADALATACMVLGLDSALQMINGISEADCYLIYADNDTLAVCKTGVLNQCIEVK